MSKVIEIYDSDDDSPKVTRISDVSASPGIAIPSSNSIPPESNCTDNISDLAISAPGSVSPPPLVISEVTSISTSPLSAIGSLHGSPIPATTSSSAVPKVSISNAGIKQQTKRSRRKSMHHPLCASPEIEFETIALDDDEDNAPAKTKIKNTSSLNGNSDAAHEIQSQKTASKMPNSKTSTSFEAQLTNACNEFLNSDETKALLRQIAEDRVRINFLLASYNMPEIKFSLYSQPEVLQFQLDERIKNRRRRFIEQAKQIKKRRDLLQNSTGRTSS